MSNGSDDKAEKAVKLLVEYYRLLLTVVGLFIAGLFAFAGRSSNVLEWKYFVAQGSLISAGLILLISFSSVVAQAAEGKYDARNPVLAVSYCISMFLVVTGLAFTGWIFVSVSPGRAAQNSMPSSGIRIDGQTINAATDIKYRVRTLYDPATGKLQAIEINSP